LLLLVVPVSSNCDLSSDVMTVTMKLLSYLILAYQTVIDAGLNEDTGTCLHRQSPELLQPTLCWGQWPIAGQAAVPPEGCSALHPSGVAKSSTSFGWGKGWNVTSDGWQATHMAREFQ